MAEVWEVWGATWAEWECTSLRFPQDNCADQKTHTRESVGFLILDGFLFEFLYQCLVGGTEDDAVELLSVIVDQAHPLD